MKSDPMPPAERHRRARASVARMIEEVGQLAVDLASVGTAPEAHLALVANRQRHEGLAEYAGMIDDALAGREPYAKGATAIKCRKAFGYGGRGR